MPCYRRWSMEVRPSPDFWPQVEKAGPDDCWLWVGPLDKWGYGKYRYFGAHQMAYFLLVGRVPEGLELDHLCHTPACVNPRHLEPVTHLENMRRRYALMTHCKRGHEFTPENTRVWSGRRNCRACDRLRQRAYQARKRGAAA